MLPGNEVATRNYVVRRHDLCWFVHSLRHVFIHILLATEELVACLVQLYGVIDFELTFLYEKLNHRNRAE